MQTDEKIHMAKITDIFEAFCREAHPNTCKLINYR